MIPLPNIGRAEKLKQQALKAEGSCLLPRSPSPLPPTPHMENEQFWLDLMASLSPLCLHGESKALSKGSEWLLISFCHLLRYTFPVVGL